jgi:hypothetical protein
MVSSVGRRHGSESKYVEGRQTGSGFSSNWRKIPITLKMRLLWFRPVFSSLFFFRPNTSVIVPSETAET